jgi:hypothetical protein
MPTNRAPFTTSILDVGLEKLVLCQPLVRSFDIDDVGRSGVYTADEMVDEWGRQSFPASDPPSNW